MLERKDSLRRFVAVIIALGILGVVVWALKNFIQPNEEKTVNVNGTSNSFSDSLDEQMSFGEKNLVDRELTLNIPAFQEAKKQGMEGMAQKQYQKAVENFKNALAIAPNAPLTRIYLSNAEIGNAEAYTIAVPVPIQAKEKYDPIEALEMLRGFAQAQYEINQKGGIRGKRIKLQVIDDDDNPEIAKKIAEKLVQDKKVIGVMGHASSEVSLAVAPIYANGKLVFITPVSTSNNLNNPDNALNNGKRYVFRTNIDTQIAAQNLVRYMHDTFDVHKVAVFYDNEKDSQYNRELREEFTKILVNSYKGKIVYKDDLSKGGSNYPAKEKYKQAIEKGTQAFLLLPSSKTVTHALDVISAIPKNTSESQGIKVLGDISNLYGSNTLNRGKDTQGMVLAVPLYLNSEDQFSRQAKELWKDKIDSAWKTATSYDAAQVFIEALKRNPASEALPEEICKEGFQAKGTSGDSLRFDCLDSSSPQQKVKLVQVSPPDSSNKQYHFKLIEHQPKNHKDD
ncbi:MAG: ABC transporter substrate-binding protein [Brasilonema angustatum HA4187-MV1]|jgi:ABC-type branched-subunit amino acid transport system substrate-binding protein|nr:ABC transporter substrate-binding protein [Brasilonema angustatum HA4187-MV1]